MIEILQDFENTSFSMLLYGQSGIGKTTFSARADRVLIANIENGLKGVDLKESGAYATSHIQSYEDFLEVCEKFHSSEKFKTLVVDSMTRLQELIVKTICVEGNKRSLQEFPYGTGYGKFTAEAQVVCEWIDVMKSAGKNVILIAHEQVENFADPENDAYDRFSIALDKRIAEKFKAAVDHVWYMHYEKSMRESSSGRQTAKHRGRVLIQTRPSGGVIAKTRGNHEQFITVKNDSSAKEIWSRI